MTLQGTLATDDRHDWLLERLDADGTVSIAEAAAELAVSEMTIRRDLTALEERGVARRVRGGARAVAQPFARRDERAAREKSQIAAKAATQLRNAGLVALDASSTVMRLVSFLADAHQQRVTVATNGPDTFNALQRRPGLTPLLTGGELDQRTGSLVGPLAARALEQLAFDICFISAAAVDARGALEATIEEAEVKRVLAQVSDRVVLCVDSSKLSGRAMAIGVPWDRIDTLVTDLDPDDGRLEPFRDLVEEIL